MKVRSFSTLSRLSRQFDTSRTLVSFVERRRYKSTALHATSSLVNATPRYSFMQLASPETERSFEIEDAIQDEGAANNVPGRQAPDLLPQVERARRERMYRSRQVRQENQLKAEDPKSERYPSQRQSTTAARESDLQHSSSFSSTLHSSFSTHSSRDQLPPEEVEELLQRYASQPETPLSMKRFLVSQLKTP